MKANKASIVFSGDIGFDRYMDRRYEDDALIGKDILNFFHSADHVCVNVEGAMIDATNDGSKGNYIHSMSPDAARTLKQINADIWCICNNHIMDAGQKGLISTLKIAESAGAYTVGAGLNEEAASKPVFLKEAGGIGIIGVGYTPDCIPASDSAAGNFRWDNMELISSRIAEIKKSCRWCIVVSHGGEEFACLPAPYTRDRYLKYLSFGADAVVAHHPHVPENYELLDNGKAIFYSLGNFIFDTDYQRAHKYTDIGVLLKLKFTEDSMTFEAVGSRIIRGEEKIEIAPLPDIFENISAEEYTKLAPMAVKAFIEEEKRRKIFMDPKSFKDASEDHWNKYFFNSERSNLVKGEHMDFDYLIQFSETASPEDWEKSLLTRVKQYIMSLLE